MNIIKVLWVNRNIGRNYIKEKIMVTLIIFFHLLSINDEMDIVMYGTRIKPRVFIPQGELDLY